MIREIDRVYKLTARRAPDVIEPGGVLDASFFEELETVIEITEQTAVQNLQAASLQITELVERGCQFAIDDFGSGYCSYNYLKTLPVSFVKIDGSFITNLTDDPVNRKIVNAICEIADAAGCETIAEHVEDYETFLLLDELGVAYAPGYALGKPTVKIRSATLPVPFVARARSPRISSKPPVGAASGASTIHLKNQRSRPCATCAALGSTWAAGSMPAG